VPDTIYTHLWYAKDAEEAARLYTSIFPDSGIDHVTALRSETPSGPPGSVTVVDFHLFGRRFRAIGAGPHHEFNDAVSIVVACDDQAELDRYWHALLDAAAARRLSVLSSTGTDCAATCAVQLASANRANVSGLPATAVRSAFASTR
jgi:predicted 3-demethylubiquinone-9 3-methyltransferase (glyoxalase superfamily)